MQLGFVHGLRAAKTNGRPYLVQQSANDRTSDEALDEYILRRLELLGVDLSVLPVDDPDAPADRTRILASARRFLRSTPGAIAEFPFETTGPPPAIYPAGLTTWGGDAGDAGDSG